MFLALQTSLPPRSPPPMDRVILVSHSVQITLLSSTYLCIFFVNVVSYVVMLLTYMIDICKTFMDVLCWLHFM